MGVTDKSQYQWSDWFSKPEPARAGEESPPAHGPQTDRPAAGLGETPTAPTPIPPTPATPGGDEAGAGPAGDDPAPDGAGSDAPPGPVPAESGAEQVPAGTGPVPAEIGTEPFAAHEPAAATPGRPDPQPTRPQPAVSRSDPQPTRPQPVVSGQEPPATRPQPRVHRSAAQATLSEPQATRPEPQVTPMERNRPAGALPWILPTGGQAGHQAAGAPAASGLTGAPPADPAAERDQPPAVDATAVQPAVPAEEKTLSPEAAPLETTPPETTPLDTAAPETAPPGALTPGALTPERAAPEKDDAPAEPGKDNHVPPGRAGPSATYKRPELVSAADTVMLPKLRPRQGAPAGQRAAAKKASASSSAGATGTDDAPVAVDQERTTMFPAQTMPLSVADPARPEQPYRPSERRKWISRAVLLAIVIMQAVLSLRLRNTAFEDEAQYLYAGRLEIAHLFHGAPLPINFASYFSGSPVLYPVLGAAANNVGGLAAARAVSLLEMLSTTALLYAISRRLFNERVAICAALLFSVTASVTFLGDFATFDASCLFLLAVASWIMVRTAVSRWPLFLLAAPVAALAVATKYAGLLFVPTIAVLPALTAWPYHRRRAFAYPVIFVVAVAGLLYGAVRWGGHSYIQALQQTTTSRAQGNTPLTTILWESVKWGGLQFGVAVIGTIAYAWRARTDPDEDISPAGSRLRRILVGLVLTGSALLAPAYQAHLHTDVSFHKHIGFGLFFAAPMAGVGLARIVGDHFRRPQLGIAVWGLAILVGMTQSAILFGGWGNSTGLSKVLARQLKPGARYLVEVPEVPTYYLQGRPGAQATQFYSTFVIFYVDPQGQTLTGDAGFEVAIKNGFFQVIAYEGTITPAVDNILASELKKSSLYRLAAVVPDNTAYHTGSYYVWVKKTASTAGTGKVTSKAGT